MVQIHHGGPILLKEEIMRHLASIQKIKEVIKHPNADILDIITVLGWKCVSKSGTFKEGDLCVYVFI